MDKKLRTKKGVSLLISYVLLIVIAITMAAILYAWLQTYIPKDKTECPEDVSLIIRDYNCGESIDGVEADGYFTISFQNKGFHDIDGGYIRFSNESGKIPVYIPLVPEDSFNLPGVFLFPEFTPGEGTWEKTFNYHVSTSGTLGVECAPSEGNCASQVRLVNIQPFVYDADTGDIAICEDAVITHEVVCPAP